MCGKDGDSNTAGETYHNGVGNIFDDGAQTQHAQQDEEDTRHERGNSQSLHAILLDDAVDDNDEGSRWAANLYLRAPEERNHQSCYDGSNDAFLGTHTTGDTESDCQRKCYDAHNETGHEVGHECLLIVILECREQFRLEIQCLFHLETMSVLFGAKVQKKRLTAKYPSVFLYINKV